MPHFPTQASRGLLRGIGREPVSGREHRPASGREHRALALCAWHSGPETCFLPIPPTHLCLLSCTGFYTGLRYQPSETLPQSDQPHPKAVASPLSSPGLLTIPLTQGHIPLPHVHGRSYKEGWLGETRNKIAQSILSSLFIYSA